jgi:hypothetical protein
MKTANTSLHLEKKRKIVLGLVLTMKTRGSSCKVSALKLTPITMINIPHTKLELMLVSMVKPKRSISDA